MLPPLRRVCVVEASIPSILMRESNNTGPQRITRAYQRPGVGGSKEMVRSSSGEKSTNPRSTKTPTR